jgi:hypothetical protein
VPLRNRQVFESDERRLCLLSGEQSLGTRPYSKVHGSHEFRNIGDGRFCRRAAGTDDGEAILWDLLDVAPAPPMTMLSAAKTG